MIRNKILIVDDEPNVCNFLSEFLDYKGFESTITLSGKEALNQLESEDFDLVLLDLIMPEMNGFEVLERINQMDNKVPVIILTGVRDQNVANDSMEMGAVDFISKPIDLDRLEQSIIVNIKNLK
ncbi:MAG: response regulator [Candidatus Marinimicrobia bacterium]|nr:response regulator [Candidatus Neomarinimicrobiota bacterium]